MKVGGRFCCVQGIIHRDMKVVGQFPWRKAFFSHSEVVRGPPTGAGQHRLQRHEGWPSCMVSTCSGVAKCVWCICRACLRAYAYVSFACLCDRGWHRCLERSESWCP
eukprot:385894-Pelagomonas_calceolata.AAC.3